MEAGGLQVLHGRGGGPHARKDHPSTAIKLGRVAAIHDFYA
jgi:hypothetical protein